MFQEIFDFAPSSDLKQSDGSDVGKFPFYTSKQQVESYYFKAQYLFPALIIGLGDSPFVQFEDRPFSVANDCLVVFCKEEMRYKINLKYVYYFFLAFPDLLQKPVKSRKKKDLLKEIEIQVVSLAEQNEMVAVMDRISVIADKRRKVLERLQEYQKSLFLEMFGDPVINPKKHVLRKTGDVIPIIDIGMSFSCENSPRTCERDFAVLRQDAITKRFFDAEQNKYFEKEKVKDKINDKWFVHKGDVLFSRKNDLKHIGSTVYVFEDCHNLLFPDTIYKLRYDRNELSGVFLSFLMNDTNFHQKLTRFTTGTMVSMSNISIKNLNVVEIPVPDMELQKNFEHLIMLNQNYIERTRGQLRAVLNLFQSAFRFLLLNGVSVDRDFKLEILLKNVSLDNRFEDCFLFEDRALLDLFIERVAEADRSAFDKDDYDRMKHVLFGLLKAGVLKQKFDPEQNKMIICHEVAPIKNR